MEIQYLYQLTTNELLIFCIASTLTGSLMTTAGLLISRNPRVAKATIELFRRLKKGFGV